MRPTAVRCRILCLLACACAGVVSHAAGAGSGGPSEAERQAIERLLEQGHDARAQQRVDARIAGLPPDTPPLQQAEWQLLRATALAHGETRHDDTIAAATRARELAAMVPDAGADVAREALRFRGLAHARKREPQAALADLREYVRATRQLGEGSAALALALSDLSLAQRVAAEYGAALSSLDEAATILRRQDPPDATELATTLIRLGQTRRISGDLDGAERAYAEALALDERTPDPSGRNRAVVLYALGNLYRNRNDADRAIAYYARAVPAAERAYGADSVILATMLNNYGNAESLRAGRGDAAVALFRRSLAIADRNHSEDPGHYVAYGNIGMVRIWQRRYIEAESGFRAMLRHVRDAPAGSETSPLFAWHGLAAALWGQGRHADAFAAAATAEATRQAAVREVAATLSDEQALAFQDQDYETLDHALAIALDSADAKLLARAWTLAIGARGQITAIQAQRLAQARASTEPTLSALWNEWKSAGAALEAAAPSRREDARRQLAAIERRLAQALPQGDALTGTAIDIDALRKDLPADSALVWLHDLRHRKPYDFANDAVDRRAAETWAFILPAGNAPIRPLRLGSAVAIAADLAAWQAQLGNPSSSLARVRELGGRLAQAVWQPIADSTKATRVFIVAEGPLLRLPWAALPQGDGWLVERGPALHLLNHERELRLPSARAAATHALLAVADPRGDHAGAPLRRGECTQAQTLPALPGARREVARLAALLDEDGSRAPLLSLVGDEASEARFRREAPHASVLHLATHGVLAGANACADADTRGVTLSATAGPDDAGAPMALLFAAPTAASGDDGLLHGAEIAALDLSAVRWAVLAACSTSSGSTRTYEGLYGLARAFRLAGAATVLSSLWPVDDEATAQWSEALYRARLHDGVDTPTALQRAQRSVLVGRRASGRSEHPWYWAGFVAIGDWH
jgi:CHAT domain-containing protein